MSIEKSALRRSAPIIKNRFVFLSIITFLFLTGCNKTDDYEDLELLLNKNWQLISIFQGGIDITNECDLDDVLLFKDATKFTFNYGTLSCFEDDLIITGDTWKIIDDFTVLRMKYKFSGDGRGSMVRYYKIIELNEYSLVVADELYDDNDQIPEIRTFHN